MAATVAYPQPLSVDLTKRWTQCFNASWPQQTTTSPPWVQNNQMKGLPITNPNTSYWSTPHHTTPHTHLIRHHSLPLPLPPLAAHRL